MDRNRTRTKTIEMIVRGRRRTLLFSAGNEAWSVSRGRKGRRDTTVVRRRNRKVVWFPLAPRPTDPRFDLPSKKVISLFYIQTKSSILIKTNTHSSPGHSINIFAETPCHILLKLSYTTLNRIDNSRPQHTAYSASFRLISRQRTSGEKQRKAKHHRKSAQEQSFFPSHDSIGRTTKEAADVNSD